MPLRPDDAIFVVTTISDWVLYERERVPGQAPPTTNMLS